MSTADNRIRMAAETPTRPRSLAKQFGLAITAHRMSQAKSQRAQARELRIAGNTLRELEQGDANPTLGRVEEVADKLGLIVELKVRKRARR